MVRFWPTLYTGKKDGRNIEIYVRATYRFEYRDYTSC